MVAWHGKAIIIDFFLSFDLHQLTIDGTRLCKDSNKALTLVAWFEAKKSVRGNEKEKNVKPDEISRKMRNLCMECKRKQIKM